MNITLRKLSFVGFLICSSALIGAVILEQQYMLSPCPMCMLQRIAFACLGFTFLVGTVIHFKSALRYVYSLVILLFATIGFAIAAKQFWLQYFAPPQKISCSAGLERLIEAYPILDALKIALRGSAACSVIDFTIFTISISGWSVIMFGTFIVLTIYIIYLQKKRWI